MVLAEDEYLQEKAVELQAEKIFLLVATSSTAKQTVTSSMSIVRAANKLCSGSCTSSNATDLGVRVAHAFFRSVFGFGSKEETSDLHPWLSQK